MGLLICAFGVLCLFFLRDVFILGSKQEHASAKLALYCILTSIYLVASIRMAYSLPEGRALALLGSAWIWAVTLVMHLGLWLAVTQLKRRPNGGHRMWLITLAPAPMLILSIIAVSHRLPPVIHTSSALSAGLIATAVWIVLILTGAIVFRALYRGWEDWECVADLAEIASWTGIGILPFTGVLQWLQVLVTYD